MFNKFLKIFLATILVLSSLPLQRVSAFEDLEEEGNENLLIEENADSIDVSESKVKTVLPSDTLIEGEQKENLLEIDGDFTGQNKSVEETDPLKRISGLNISRYSTSSAQLTFIVDENNNNYVVGRDLADFETQFPILDINMPKVKKGVTSSSSNSGFIDLDGNLWLWGSNRSGQLALDTATVSVNNRNMVRIPLYNVVDAHIGQNSVAVLEDGSVWQWGQKLIRKSNNTTEYSTEIYMPEKIEGIENAVSVEYGEDHYLVLTEDGYVFTWGFDAFRKLGRSCRDEDYTNNSHYSGVYLNPIHLGACAGNYVFPNIIKVDSSYFTSFALKENGDLLTWGKSAYNMLGTTDTYGEVQTPTKMKGFEGRILDFSIGRIHGIAVDEYGQLYSWGDNSSGQLGLGFKENYNYQNVTKLETPNNVLFVSVHADEDSSFALDVNGNIWSWGSNGYNSLGIELGANPLVPSKIPNLRMKFEGLEEVKEDISGKYSRYLKEREEDKIDANSLVADPVDTATGALIIEEILIPTNKTEYSYKVDYNSLSSRNGGYGTKWFGPRDMDYVSKGSHYNQVHLTNMFSLDVYKDIDGKPYLKNKDYKIKGERPHFILVNKEGIEYYFRYGLEEIIFPNQDVIDSYGTTIIELSNSENGRGKGRIFKYSESTFKLGNTSLYNKITLNDTHTVVLNYDENKNLTEIIKPNGDKTRYVYDSESNITEGYKNDILFMKNKYDEKSRVIEQEDSLGNLTKFKYEEDGETVTTTVTNRNGQSKKLVHDTKFNLIKEIDEIGNETTHSYNEDNNRIKTTFPNGTSIKMKYDERDNLISIENQLGHKTLMTYDEKNNLVELTNPLGEKVKNTYNDSKQLTKVEFSNGNYTDYIYKNYLLVETKDSYNNSIKYSYSNANLAKITNKIGGIREFIYDYQGNIKTVKDEKGRISKYDYDLLGRLTKSTNPLNQVLEQTYNPFGDVTSIIDFSGLTTLYDYDNNGNLKSQKVEDRELQFSYDNEGNLIESISPKGYSTSAELNALGRVIKETDTEGLITTYKYDRVGNLIETNFNGAITKNKYDAANNLIEIINPEGNITKYEYDKLGRVAKGINALGGTTSYVYDFNSNVTSMTDPEGNVIRNEYDLNGNKTKTIDAKGNEYLYEYDPAGRLVKEINPLGEVNTFEYDAVDNLTISRNNASKIYAKEYDVLDRLTVDKDPNSNSIKYTYDTSGNLKETIDALGNKVVNVTYDKFNNPIEVEDVFGNKIKNVFDKENNLIETIDQLNRSTKYEYDSKGRVKKITDKSSTVSLVNYDQYGNISSFTDPNENNTNYTFNKMGQITSEINQTGNTLRYTYDQLGQMASYKNGRGQESKYVYDKVGNVKKVTSPEGVTTYEYDANYNVTKVSETIGSVVKTLEYKYDALNRMSEYKDEFGNVIKYKYDSLGNLSELIYPDGKKVTYEYDDVGNLLKVKDWNDNVTTYTYDKNYNATKTLIPNGTSELREYDKKGQLTKLTHLSKTGSAMKEFTYQYDVVGNVIKENNKTYQYDELDRIVKVNSDEYEYDAAGNLTLVKKDDQEVDMTYGADNQLTGIEEQLLNYDNDGNLLDIPLKDSLAEAIYDSKNRLIQLGDSKYSYSPTGKRTTILEDGESTRFVINPNAELDQVLMETDVDGSPTAYYVYGSGLIAKYDVDEATAGGSGNDSEGSDNDGENSNTENEDPAVGENPADSSSSEEGESSTGTGFGSGNGDTTTFSVDTSNSDIHYYHYDSRGSTILLTNAAGAITDIIEYDIYGEILESTGNTENRFKYNGKYGVQTDSSGLYQMRSRYYNPEIKRFINRDVVIGNVLDPQTFNRYSYVNGNPVSYIDPFGLSRETTKNFFKGVYDFLIGDDINTLMNPNSSALEKAWAGISIASNFIPGAGPAVKGLSLTVKGASKLLKGVNATSKSSKGIRTQKHIQSNSSNVYNQACNRAGAIPVKKSFAAGTLVLTDTGLIPIEDIHLGDSVLAKDTETGELDYKEVITLFERTAEEGSYTITVEGEEIIATPNHPFWVEGKGWLRADELSIDDFFVDEEGNLLDITAIEIDQTPLVVYNFEVEDYHTYFVGYSNLLTHNLNCGGKETFESFLAKDHNKVKNTQVYLLRNDDNVPIYVGITNNASRRGIEHSKTKDFSGEASVIIDDLTWGEARAVETFLIDKLKDKYGAKYKKSSNGQWIVQNENALNINKSRSIGGTRDFFPEAMQWADDELRKRNLNRIWEE